MDDITLRNEHISVQIDAGRGADILSLTHLRSGIDVLFSSPWRSHADDVRAGRTAPTTSDPVAGWLEQYRGGWQVLCPNAGPPRVVHGAPVGFHGEASTLRWHVVQASDLSVLLRTDLFSVPVVIDRLLTLSDIGTSLQIYDTLTNLSDVELELDYVSHPAFGGPFLEGTCRIDTGARTFTTDPDTDGNVAEPATSHAWPHVSGSGLDLREVAKQGERRMVFGWLSDFTSHWASITNEDLGLGVRLEWDGTHLPYAWFWQELNHSVGFPWYRRARVIAIEPSSTQTSGPDRRSVLTLAPHASVRIPLTVTLEEGDRTS